MDLDTNKIDDAVLALLYLGLHNGARAWKGFDSDAMGGKKCQEPISQIAIEFLTPFQSPGL
jgi:hypothetical protein